MNAAIWFLISVWPLICLTLGFFIGKSSEELDPLFPTLFGLMVCTSFVVGATSLIMMVVKVFIYNIP